MSSKSHFLSYWPCLWCLPLWCPCPQMTWHNFFHFWLPARNATSEAPKANLPGIFLWRIVLQNSSSSSQHASSCQCLQDAESQVLKGFRFYGIQDCSQKCFIDNSGFWANDKTFHCVEGPHESLIICPQWKEEEIHGEYKGKLIIQNYTTTYCWQVLKSLSRIFLCFNAKYLSIHKLHFRQKRFILCKCICNLFFFSLSVWH